MFPEMKGFSLRNLKYMRAFAAAYPDGQFVQEVLAQITWYHHITLLDKVKDAHERLWYIEQSSQQGWSRNVLVIQIETGAYQRKGKALTNFKSTLPSPQSDLAHDILKDPYLFDFITTHQEAKERNIQSALLSHIQQFLLELGVGFLQLVFQRLAELSRVGVELGEVLDPPRRLPVVDVPVDRQRAEYRRGQGRDRDHGGQAPADSPVRQREP